MNTPAFTRGGSRGTARSGSVSSCRMRAKIALAADDAALPRQYCAQIFRKGVPKSLPNSANASSGRSITFGFIASRTNFANPAGHSYLRSLRETAVPQRSTRLSRTPPPSLHRHLAPAAQGVGELSQPMLGTERIRVRRYQAQVVVGHWLECIAATAFGPQNSEA